MAKCRVCGGSGRCKTCHGTGEVKELNPHPSPWDVREDGRVTCFACGGSGTCGQCDGSGLDDD